MSGSTRYELLRRLCLSPGPPGGEGAVRSVVRDELSGSGTISYDGLGSILCECTGPEGGPRVVLDSHLDEVAFMVQSVADDGRLAFVPLGGWWGHVLLGQRVDVLTDEGGLVPAVVGCKPPHFLSEDERQRVMAIETMYLDVGADGRAAVEACGVRVGDLAVPHAPFVEMRVEGIVSAKALDNRIGVALMIETLRAVAKTRAHPNTLIGVGAVQEEVGLRGAHTSSTLARPDVALVLECTPADDLQDSASPQARLGGGPQLRFSDPTAIANRRLARLVAETAEAAEIPLQRAVRRSGGTDAGSIQRWGAGVPTVAIGVPGRYIHSHVSMTQWSDYEAARSLVKALVARLDADTVARLTDYESEF